MQNFMTYANMNNAVNSRNQSTYFPGTDPKGPYFFLPSQCYMRILDTNKTEDWGSPVIGYIERNNSI